MSVFICTTYLFLMCKEDLKAVLYIFTYRLCINVLYHTFIVRLLAQQNMPIQDIHFNNIFVFSLVRITTYHRNNFHH